MKLSDTDTRNSNHNWFSSDSEKDEEERIEPDIFNLALFKKIVESIKDICHMCVESNNTRIVKYKAMTSTIQKLEEIHANL